MIDFNDSTHLAIVAVYYADKRGKEVLLLGDHHGLFRNPGKRLRPKVKTVLKLDILKSRYVAALVVAMGNCRCKSGQSGKCY